MQQYRIADAIVESNISLPEAKSAFGQEAECAFHWMLPRDAPPPSAAPFHEWLGPSGEPFVWFFRHRSGYLIRFRRFADFLVSNQADEVHCYPRPEVPLDTIRHLFLDQVLPLVLSRRGRLSLHASAVVTPNGAVIFVGKSGLGKSTLAAYLAHQGFPVLCDDFVVLNQQRAHTLVVPSYPGIRLWPDALSTLFDHGVHTTPVAHYSEKRRLAPADDDGCLVPMPLARVYVLSNEEDAWEGADVAAQTLSQRESVIELSKYAHLLDVTDRDSLRQSFNKLTVLVDAIPCYRLFFPYDFSQLPDVCEVVSGFRPRAE
jgi:hypothetical protein